MSTQQLGCDYQGHEFGASYLDSVCIDGFLWDADSCDAPGDKTLHRGGEIPCPECNHEAWLEYHKEEALNDGGVAFLEGKPESACPFPEKARYPQDGEKLKQWWLEGWRDAKLEETMDDPDKVYEEFWKEIVENPDGSINMEQLKKELHDFSVVMNQVPKVYGHVTGNRISKVNTLAQAVIGEADDRVQEAVDEAVKEAKDDLVAKIIDYLSGYEHDPENWLIARFISDKVKELAGENG
jgi:hypothetical protein